MASRTQIVCLCEGKKGRSIDPVFINRLMKSLDPSWLRPWDGSNVIRLVPCGGRNGVVEQLPEEIKNCVGAGGDTTLMVWADCDDDCDDGDALKDKFWRDANESGIAQVDFNRIVFVFAKDRLENWIQFLTTGQTDETVEAPRIKHDKVAAEAAKKLASMCKEGRPVSGMPPSLEWSCKNWQALVKRMKKA